MFAKVFHLKTLYFVQRLVATKKRTKGLHGNKSKKLIAMSAITTTQPQQLIHVRAIEKRSDLSQNRVSALVTIDKSGAASKEIGASVKALDDKNGASGRKSQG